MKTGQITPAVVIVGLLAASVPLSLYTTSLFTIALFCYWILEGVAFRKEYGYFQAIQTKWGLFIKNPAAVVFSSLYLLYLAGSFWSSNSHEAFRDLQEKLPILILPILFTGIKPFDDKQFKAILLVFIMGVFAGTLHGFYILITQQIADTRELSPYIHHIRFSMNICLALFIVFRLWVTGPKRHPFEKLYILILFCWLAAFLFILKSLTGILLFTGFLFYVMIYFSGKLKKRWLRKGAIAILILLPLFFFSFIYTIYNRHFNIAAPNLSMLETKTALGNTYYHDTISFKVENGSYVGLYLCEQELKENWEKRSKLSYKGKNLQGGELRYTIIRYLNAKGLRKDSVGLSKLTPNEITAIEKGVANPGLIQPFNLSARLEEVFIDYEQYRSKGDANGKPEMQRLEYWKTAVYIIRQNWITGVGTGDVMAAFNAAYDHNHSKLEPTFRGTSHNQYLYMGVAFGIGGIFLFLFWLIYPPYKLGAFRDYYYVALFCIMILSMLTEDTIRHQAGLNFMVFFSCLFLFGREKGFVDKKQTGIFN
jgi:O-antigen ligase